MTARGDPPSCLLALTLWLASVTGAAAQTDRIHAPDILPSMTSVASADRLLDSGAVRASFDLLAAHLTAEPDDFDARWRAARAAVFLGIMAGDARAGASWYRIGVAQADSALRMRPDDRDALRWEVASKGRLALQAGAEESVRLATEVWDLDHHLLSLYPDDPLAHDVLGTLNYEVMSLSGLKRMLGRMFMGGALLAAANWRDALEQHRTAVSLDPGSVLFRVDLANTLVKLGHVDEAVAQFEAAVALPEQLPIDGVFKARARRRLDQLRPSRANPPNPERVP